MHRRHDGWLLILTLACSFAACSGGRGERLDSEHLDGQCGHDAGRCPMGSVCQNGQCVEEQATRTALSASGRPEGASAAIEWVAENGVSCVQTQATTCTVDPGGKLTLKAPHVPGYRFAGWHGPAGCASDDPVLTLVVQKDIDCVARYVPRVRVTGAIPGEGGNIIASSDSEFARCADGTCEVDRGAQVKLLAPERDGFRLAGWEGEGCALGMADGYALTLRADQDATCAATFIPSLTVRGVAEGATAMIRASSTGAAARCSEQLCAVDPGDRVELVAPAVDGFRFVGWIGDASCSGSELTLSVLDVRASITCTAHYIPRFSVRGMSTGAEPVPLLMALSSDAFADCSAEQCVTDQGGTVTLVAPSVAGFRLRAWTGEGCQTEAGGASTVLSDLRAHRVCTAEYVRGVAVSGTVLGATGQVVASSSSPGAACASGSCSIDTGGTVTLTAPTLPERTFLGWSGDAGCTGTNLALTLTDVTTSVSCSARFAARYQVAGTATPADLGSVAASSTATNARCSGASCAVDEGGSVTLVATADGDARFAGWSGGGACTGGNARLVLSNARANLTCRATFVARHTLTSGVTPNGSGGTTASSASAASSCVGASCVVDAGASVSVLAAAIEGFRFLGWSGCSTSAANPVVVQVTGPTTCTARMERITHVVLATAGAGGTVSASIGAAACAGARCMVPHGQGATLRATASEGFIFAGWSGCGTSTDSPLTVTNVTSDLSCMASFMRMRFTVSATHGPGGTVTATTGSMTCANASCGVDYGASVTLHAVPSTNFAFVGWSCGGSALDLPFTNVTANHSCEATFRNNLFAVNASAGAGGSLRVTAGTGASCSGAACNVTGGGAVVFEAVPNKNFIFTGWSCSQGSPAVSSAASLGFSNVDENHTCTASFRQNRYTVEVLTADALTVEASVGGAACPDNVCDVPEGGSVALRASRSGDQLIMFAGWTLCSPTEPVAASDSQTLTFDSTLQNVRKDQKCQATSAAIAVMEAYHSNGSRTPMGFDKPHVCTFGAVSPRESPNATICFIPVTATVTLTAISPTGAGFWRWECWSQNPAVASVFLTDNPLTVRGFVAGQTRFCGAYHR